MLGAVSVTSTLGRTLLHICSSAWVLVLAEHRLLPPPHTPLHHCPQLQRAQSAGALAITSTALCAVTCMFQRGSVLLWSKGQGRPSGHSKARAQCLEQRCLVPRAPCSPRWSHQPCTGCRSWKAGREQGTVMARPGGSWEGLTALCSSHRPAEPAAEQPARLQQGLGGVLQKAE